MKTVYTFNNGDNDVSVVNGATCNASVRAGCRGGPAVIHTGRDLKGSRSTT